MVLLWFDYPNQWNKLVRERQTDGHKVCSEQNCSNCGTTIALSLFLYLFSLRGKKKKIFLDVFDYSFFLLLIIIIISFDWIIKLTFGLKVSNWIMMVNKRNWYYSFIIVYWWCFWFREWERKRDWISLLEYSNKMF